MTRYELFYSPSILSFSISWHTCPSFSSRSVVERGGGDEEPGSKGIQRFSIFSALLYTEKIATALPVLTANYSHVSHSPLQHHDHCYHYVFLPHANSIPSLAKVENETTPNLD